MKVEVKNKFGSVKVMDDRYARILSKMGRVTYMTRDMVAAPAAPVASPSANSLDGLDAEALHELAKARGVKVHHKAGADKVRAALLKAGE